MNAKERVMCVLNNQKPDRMVILNIFKLQNCRLPHQSANI